MRVLVGFGRQELALDIGEDRLVAIWNGPDPLEPAEVRRRVADAIEHPEDYPALREAVVPGDRVVIALDHATPLAAEILDPVIESLNGRGVSTDEIHLLSNGPPPDDWPPAGKLKALAWHSHDPNDRSGIAYLASTAEGRRIYLSRALTDADFVLPIGRFTFDAATGHRGPWSVIFPDLSDAETAREYHQKGRNGRRQGENEEEALGESANVSWLLGSQLQLGLLPARGGVGGVVAGVEAAVQREGRRLLDESWSFRPPGQADLVVAGVGASARGAGFAQLGSALATATRLVPRGGKVVVLSEIGEEPGPALSRLIGVEDPNEGVAALKHVRNEPDYPHARQLALALAHARVYLWSQLGEDLVEDLGMIALGKPEEARRLVEAAPSCIVVNGADMTRVEAAPES